MQIGDLIQKNVAQYLHYIKTFSNTSRTHHFSHKNGGFPIFIENNIEYHEQSFFDELIENAIWRYLVNGVLKDLFADEKCNRRGIVCEWTSMHPQLTTSYVDDIENRYPIEFTISNDKRIGYRYTNCYFSEETFRKIFDNYMLDEMIILDFSSERQSSFLHPLMVSPEYRNRVQRLSFREFFSSCFSEEGYNKYLSEIRKTVAESYKYVGMQTVTNLNTQYLPFFLEAENEAIQNFPYPNKNYVIINGLKAKASQWYGSGIIPEPDKDKIRTSFFDKKHYLALIGNKNFSKSFITSEYLYHTLKDNNHFDFTAIVSGYLKSIEQLLFDILNIILNDGHTEDIWIQSTKNYRSRRAQRTPDQFRVNPEDSRRTQVKVFPGNQDCFDISFAALVHMVKEYNNGWTVSPAASDVISALLLTYCDECRNEHFHKDNISSIQEVEVIRDNTYLLLYYLLGGYNYAKNGLDEFRILGIVDNSFDRMYRAIMRFGAGNYYLLKFDTEEPILVALPMAQEMPDYNEDGIMKDPSLRLVKIARSLEDDWHLDNWSEIEQEHSIEKTIILTPENMPASVTYINKMTGNTTAVMW